MFELALKAKLPLITVSTTDVVNAPIVIDYYVMGCKLIEVTHMHKLNHFEEEYLVVDVGRYEIKKIPELYNTAMKFKKVVIFLNMKKDHPMVFNAGSLPIPDKLIMQELGNSGFDLGDIKNLLPVLTGMTLFDIGTAARLAISKFGELTPNGIASIKSATFNGTGLVSIDTTQDFYLPDPKLEKYIADEQLFFTKNTPAPFKPRGLMIHGTPGTGKSQSVKYLAHAWGIPAFRVEWSMVMGKYVGQSENRMASLLQLLDSQAPCAVLLDEIEKALNPGESSSHDVTSRLLSQLLWWLQEHTSEVLVIMTSNNLKALPQELYRPGRLDKVLSFGGLSWVEAFDFAVQMFKVYSDVYDLDKNLLTLRMIEKDMDSVHGQTTISHSEICGIVKALIKKQLKEV
ncbi:MAG: AAA family ATPase [Aliifodinibius sp.]|nr:ATP-binding protein [Fodinibius sp.]NIV09965.1 AAA family ATPase [Fodinibius sp.]NIY23495.1 AAA family ATPase [Fodinibius sp.]